MKRKSYIAIAVFGISTLLMADFTDDFQNALKLYNEGKNAEACEKFMELVKPAPNTGSKSDTLYYAAMSAIKMQQFEKAEELIGQIQRESSKKLCQMNLMLAQGKLNELVKVFKDEDFTKWADFNIHDGLIARGVAYMRLNQYAEALKEMSKIGSAKSGYWQTRPLVVMAEIYAAQGKKAEALAKYNEALQGAPDDLKKSIQTAIEKLK